MVGLKLLWVEDGLLMDPPSVGTVDVEPLENKEHRISSSTPTFLSYLFICFTFSCSNLSKGKVKMHFLLLC